MTHADAILSLLVRRGTWITTAEILRDVPSIVHSRIADLRKRGYTIQHRTTGVGAAGSEYRLVALQGGAGQPAAALPSSALSEREDHSQSETSKDIPAAHLSTPEGGAGTRDDRSLSLTERAALRDWPAAPTPHVGTPSDEGAAPDDSEMAAGQLNLIDVRRSWPPRQTCPACGRTFYNAWAHSEECLGR
jgi:hypothetical protein